MTMPASDRDIHHLSDAELNDLIDGTLAAGDSAAARAHLATCAECEERYLTLQATVSALRNAPIVMPRRSFQLTPEQAKLPEKAPGWFDRFAQRVMPSLPAIRAATLAVALLLLSVTAIDVVTHRDEGSNQAPTTSMRQSDEALPTNAEAAGAVQPTQLLATEAPPADANDSFSAESASEPQTGAALGASDTGVAAPVAPAPAMVQSTSAAETVEQQTEATLPTGPDATASPAPVSAIESTSGGSSVSRWRIAELALLLLLIWLIVSWVGRARVAEEH